MLQIEKHLLLGFRTKYFFIHSNLGDLTQRTTDMREPQQKPAIEIGKTQKVVELCQSS